MSTAASGTSIGSGSDLVGKKDGGGSLKSAFGAMSWILGQKWFVLGLGIIATCVFFVPLAVKAPDDNPDNAKDLDDAKKKLKYARQQRLIAIILGTVFVIVPLFMKGVYDIEMTK